MTQYEAKAELARMLGVIVSLMAGACKSALRNEHAWSGSVQRAYGKCLAEYHSDTVSIWLRVVIPSAVYKLRNKLFDIIGAYHAAGGSASYEINYLLDLTTAIRSSTAALRSAGHPSEMIRQRWDIDLIRASSAIDLARAVLKTRAGYLDEQIGEQHDRIAALQWQKNGLPEDDGVTHKIESTRRELALLQGERAVVLGGLYSPMIPLMSEEDRRMIDQARAIIWEVEK